MSRALRSRTPCQWSPCHRGVVTASQPGHNKWRKDVVLIVTQCQRVRGAEPNTSEWSYVYKEPSPAGHTEDVTGGMSNLRRPVLTPIYARFKAPGLTGPWHRLPLKLLCRHLSVDLLVSPISILFQTRTVGDCPGGPGARRLRWTRWTPPLCTCLPAARCCSATPETRGAWRSCVSCCPSFDSLCPAWSAVSLRICVSKWL